MSLLWHADNAVVQTNYVESILQEPTTSHCAADTHVLVKTQDISYAARQYCQVFRLLADGWQAANAHLILRGHLPCLSLAFASTSRSPPHLSCGVLAACLSHHQATK